MHRGTRRMTTEAVKAELKNGIIRISVAFAAAMKAVAAVLFLSVVVTFEAETCLNPVTGLEEAVACMRCVSPNNPGTFRFCVEQEFYGH